MNCIFCKIINNEIPSYKIYEDESTLAFLDISQATKGHTLVVCKEHYETLLEVPEETLCHMICVAKKLAKEITDKTGAKGINILNNNYPVAGQSVPHFHIHIIPRYDENDGFNPVFKENENPDLQSTFNLFK